METQTFTAQIDKKLMSEFRAMCKSHQVSASHLVREFIKAQVKNYSKEK